MNGKKAKKKFFYETYMCARDYFQNTPFAILTVI